MIPTLRLAACLGFFAVQLPAFAASATDYPIQLVRKSVVGERYVVTIHGTQEQTMTRTVNGNPVPGQDGLVIANLEATGEVLALTPSGHEAKVKLTVQKFSRTEAGRSGEVLAPGTELIVERKGAKTEYLLGGKPVTPELAATLELVGVELGNDDSANDDQVFGTKERKKPGDSWSVNAAAAAADISKMGLAVEPANMTGSTTLAEVVKTGSQEQLRIQGALAIKNVSIPLPPGIAVKSSDMNVTYTGLFPVDLGQRVSQSGLSMVARIVCAGNLNGAELAMTITMKQSKDATYTAFVAK